MYEFQEIESTEKSYYVSLSNGINVFKEPLEQVNYICVYTCIIFCM